MKTRALLALLSASTLLLISSTASAKVTDHAMKVACDSAVWKAFAYNYLTGKPISSSQKRDGKLVTSASKALKLNGGIFRGRTDGRKMDVVVSLPYFARGDVDLTLRGGMGASATYFVCEYVRKASSRSWASFSPDDLRPVAWWRATPERTPIQKVKINRGPKPSFASSGRVLVVVASQAGSKAYNYTASMRGAAVKGSYSDSSAKKTSSGSSASRKPTGNRSSSSSGKRIGKSKSKTRRRSARRRKARRNR